MSKTVSSPHPAQIGWDEYYQTRGLQEVPWFTEQIDQDFAGFLEQHGHSFKTVLDLGTGPGTTAIDLARRGYQVTASDISPSIIVVAKQRAGKLAETIDWRVDDIIRTALNGRFDLIYDRGCFHILKPELRPDYVRQIVRLLPPRGILFIKTFSRKEPGNWGPHRFDLEELGAYFAKKFELLEWRETVFPGTLEKTPQALLAVFQLRKGEGK